MNWFRRLFRTGNEGRKTKDEGRLRPSSLIPHPSWRVPRPSSLNYFLFLFLAFFAAAVLIKTGILQSAPSTLTQANPPQNWGEVAPGEPRLASTRPSAEAGLRRVSPFQADWAGGLDGGASGTLDGTWSKYSAVDTGIVAGTDIKLQSILLRSNIFMFELRRNGSSEAKHKSIWRRRTTSYDAVQTSDTGAQVTNATPYGDTCSSPSCSIGGGFNAGIKTNIVVSVTGRETVGLEVFYEV